MSHLGSVGSEQSIIEGICLFKKTEDFVKFDKSDKRTPVKNIERIFNAVTQTAKNSNEN